MKLFFYDFEHECVRSEFELGELTTEELLISYKVLAGIRKLRMMEAATPVMAERFETLFSPEHDEHEIVFHYNKELQ